MDAVQLSKYMIEHNLGVLVKALNEITRIDTDFFTEE